MNLTPLHIAVFACENNIERGLINAFLDAFESKDYWPFELYYSGKGRDIMSPMLWEVLGSVVRSCGSGSSDSDDTDSGSNEVPKRELVLGLGLPQRGILEPTTLDTSYFQPSKTCANEELGFGSRSVLAPLSCSRPRVKPPPVRKQSNFEKIRRRGPPNKISDADE